MNDQLAVCGGKPVRTKPFPAWPIYGRAEERALIRVLRSGKWGRHEGGEVERFEREFANYQQAKHAIAVTSGTVALRIAILAAGVGEGDEVLVPPYTFLATASAVAEANATPIFVDIEPDTFNLDSKLLEAAITPRTRAIIPVHLGGLPCDMDAIMRIAKRHNLIVIEDAAHAHGAEYKGRRVGAIGHMGAFSFQSSKNLNAGEGGIITTSDDEFAARCRSIQNCGRVPGGQWYEHHTISGNYRMNEFTGALLRCQLRRLEAQCRRREENGLYLSERLSRIPGIAPQPRKADGIRHAYHLFPIHYDATQFGAPRDKFVSAMRAEGIPLTTGYTLPLYRQRMFVNLSFGPYMGYRKSRPHLNYEKMPCPVCERICASEGMWLYQNVLLGTRRDMDEIARAFEKLYEHRDQLAAWNPEKEERKR